LVDYYAKWGIKIFEALRWGMFQKSMGNTVIRETSVFIALLPCCVGEDSMLL
jgi:hypothetical protein